MTQPKRGLGRGLDALFGSPPTVEPEARAEPAAREPEPVATMQPPPSAPPPPPAPEPAAIVSAAVVPIRRGGPDQLDIDLISPNPEQPRTHFEPEKLRELADSIREHGVIQPLIVTRDAEGRALRPDHGGQSQRRLSLLQAWRA